MQEKKMQKYAEQTQQEFEGWEEFFKRHGSPLIELWFRFKPSIYARNATSDQAESLYSRGNVKVNSKPVALEGFIRK